jgi:PAS domain S-box-containing protein
MERKEPPMILRSAGFKQLQLENKRLRQEKADLTARMMEAEETLRAIQSGEVDALVVSTSQGEQVFTLKGADHTFKVLIENMSEGALTMTKEGVILYANKWFAWMVGRSLERVIGSTIIEFMATGEREGLQKFLQKEFEVSRFTGVNLVAESGDLVPVQLSLIKLQAEDMLDNICVVVTDLTEHKQIEASINAENIERVKKEEAERANLEKGQFLARMSHEIRNPMNIIIGMADLAGDAADINEQTEYLALIRNYAVSLRALLNDILDFSRIESRHLKLYLVPFNLSLEIEKLILNMLPQAHYKGLELKWSVDTAIPMFVCGDPGRLRQVLLNLVGNAIKFTEQGVVEVTLTLDQAVDKGEPALSNIVPVLFTIKDTGTGVPPDKMEQIFDLFAQVHDVNAFEHEGTGLGLPISKNLVKLMGGSIEVESDVSCGSTFYIKIPFSLPEDVIASNEEAGLAIQDDHHITLSDEKESVKLNILVVDDKPMNQKLVKVYLEKKGHIVSIASNGKEALEAHGLMQFDLIIMDINMPVMGGFEATKLIRAIEKDKGLHTPIVAMTAYAMEEDRERCLQSGMDYYVSKPIDPLELYKILEAISK